MKKNLLASITLMLVITKTSFGQDVSGQWYGLLSVPGKQLRLVLNVGSKETGYTNSTMDSPDQGATGITINTTFQDSVLSFTQDNLKITYAGKLNDKGEIDGTFKQSGYSFPLTLSKKLMEQKVRPQEPKKPYPYKTEDISFDNRKDGVTLAGTLTLPDKKGTFPAAILISGSGPQNRDEEMMGHKPFLVIADYLTRHGIAVLRIDDRGINKSTGNFSTATDEDFASDISAAIDYLESRTEVDKHKIGLIGHSEGGIIAPMAATKRKDVAYVVFLAGPGLKADSLLLLQHRAICTANGMSAEDIEQAIASNREIFNIILTNKDPKVQKELLYPKLLKAFDALPESEKESRINAELKKATSPWMQYLLRYDPAPALQKLKCPVLALNGDKDVQVPSVPNLNAIQDNLRAGNNKSVTIKELKGLNHLFQHCTTGLPNEYGNIEETFAQDALDEIKDWIVRITN